MIRIWRCNFSSLEINLVYWSGIGIIRYDFQSRSTARDLVWPLTPKIDRATRLFLKFDRVTWTRQRRWAQKDFKQQRQVTLPFLETDMRHQDPLSRAPLVGKSSGRCSPTLENTGCYGHFQTIVTCDMVF